MINIILKKILKPKITKALNHDWIVTSVVTCVKGKGKAVKPKKERWYYLENGSPQLNPPVYHLPELQGRPEGTLIQPRYDKSLRGREDGGLKPSSRFHETHPGFQIGLPVGTGREGFRVL